MIKRFGAISGCCLVAVAASATVTAAPARPTGPAVSKFLHVIWALSSPHGELAFDGSRARNAFSLRFRLHVVIRPPGGAVGESSVRSAGIYASGDTCVISGLFNGIPAYSITANGHTFSAMLDTAHPSTVWLAPANGLRLTFGQQKGKMGFSLMLVEGSVNVLFEPGGILSPDMIGGPMRLRYCPSPLRLNASGPCHGGILRTAATLNQLPWVGSIFPVSAAAVAFTPGKFGAAQSDPNSVYSTTTFSERFSLIHTGRAVIKMPIHGGVAKLRAAGFKIKTEPFAKALAKLILPVNNMGPRLNKKGHGSAADQVAIKKFERWAGIRTGDRKGGPAGRARADIHDKGTALPRTGQHLNGGQ